MSNAIVVFFVFFQMQWGEQFSNDAPELAGANEINLSDAQVPSTSSGVPRHYQQRPIRIVFDPWTEVVPVLTQYQQESQPQPQQQQPHHHQRPIRIVFDPWTEVVPVFTQYQQESQPQLQQQQQAQTEYVSRSADVSSAEVDRALSVVVVPNAHHQHQQQQPWSVRKPYDAWGEVSQTAEAPRSSSTAAPAPVPPALAQRPRGAPVKFRRRGAPVKFLKSGAHARRRISDQYNRQQKKLLGEAWVPSPVGRQAEKFDNKHTTKRQNYADVQEGLSISADIRDPVWQARLLAHAQTKQGQKALGSVAAALKTSRMADTLAKNCNDMLKGGSQAAVTFEPEELRRLYPADVVGKLTMQQCTDKLRQIGVRAPENSLDSMRKTLARIGATGSIAGEAGVRTGGKHRAELTGRLTQGMSAREAAMLLPGIPSKYITAAKAHEKDFAFVSTLGENYASNTTKVKISTAQANLYVNYFKNITDFKSGAGPHTKSRILTKQRHVVTIDLYAKYPKLLRQWCLENVTEKQRIDETAPASRTQFEADVVAAASHVEYDNSTTEHDIRATMALLEYQSRLKHNAKTQRKFGKVHPSSKGNTSNTKARLEELHKRPDAPAYLLASSPGQKPCSEEVFWKILKDNEIRYTCTVRPTICPIHDKGPSNERALKEALLEEKRLEAEFNRTTGLLDAQRAQAQEEARQNEAVERALSTYTVAVNKAKSELRQLSLKVLDLTKEVAIYHKHLAQFETSRKEVENIMDNLGPEECLVYRDFVNQHSWYDNTKVCNLILVVIWKEDGVLRSMKLNNFCSDEDSCSTDPFYVRDVFDFHMKPKSVLLGHTGLLNRFKKIYISGRVFTKPCHDITLSYR